MADVIDITNISNIGIDIGTWGLRIIFIIIFSFCVYLILFFFRKIKRYNYIVRIFNRDATGNIVQLKDDRGGVFLDKRTQYRLFLLRKNKFGLDPDDIPYILTSKGKQLVYLLQTGLKNFQYLRPQVSENPGMVFNVQDEDVAWALNAYERNKRPFSNKLIEQLLPFLGMAFVFLVVIVGFYFIFMKAGFNADLLRDLSASAERVANSIAKASIGGAIVE